MVDNFIRGVGAIVFTLICIGAFTILLCGILLVVALVMKAFGVSLGIAIIIVVIVAYLIERLGKWLY